MSVSHWSSLEGTFLLVLSKSGNVTAACKACGTTRTAAYNRRKIDPAFAEAWDEAIEEATELMELEARRRALEGCDEPVFHQGEVCGHIRKYSDTLMIFLLKAHKPQKYRDNVRLEHEGEVTIRVEYADTDDPAPAAASGPATGQA